MFPINRRIFKKGEKFRFKEFKISTCFQLILLKNFKPEFKYIDNIKSTVAVRLDKLKVNLLRQLLESSEIRLHYIQVLKYLHNRWQFVRFFGPEIKRQGWYYFRGENKTRENKGIPNHSDIVSETMRISPNQSQKRFESPLLKNACKLIRINPRLLSECIRTSLK